MPEPQLDPVGETDGVEATGRRIPLPRPLALVGVLGWLVPGLGQLMMGRVRKAVVMAVGILGLYLGGLVLTGFGCVDPEAYRLEFVAHVFAGGPTLLTLQFGDRLALPGFHPHFDVGRLYVAVASLLNVVAISDALGDAIAHNATVRELRRRRRHRDEIAAQMERAAKGTGDGEALGAPEGSL